MEYLKKDRNVIVNQRFPIILPITVALKNDRIELLQSLYGELRTLSQEHVMIATRNRSYNILKYFAEKRPDLVGIPILCAACEMDDNNIFDIVSDTYSPTNMTDQHMLAWCLQTAMRNNNLHIVDVLASKYKISVFSNDPLIWSSCLTQLIMSDNCQMARIFRNYTDDQPIYVSQNIRSQLTCLFMTQCSIEMANIIQGKYAPLEIPNVTTMEYAITNRGLDEVVKLFSALQFSSGLIALSWYIEKLSM